MFISKRLQDALNDEVTLELFAHVQYLAMAHYFEKLNLSGLAAFFYAQAEEEKEHGLKIVHFLNEAGADLHFAAVPEPRQDFGSAMDVAQLFLDQEKHVTEQFYKMNEMALEDKDYITHNFLQWFIEEQLEEMSTATKVLDLFKMVGDNLLMADMAVSRFE